MKKEYHVISHTHWDREWYQCFEHFRLRLVDLMDGLLEIFKQDPAYIFHLDAQTICLEDYLEIRPHCRAELEELVRAGRLLVGPWYVQNDFNLCSGEATVRNLLIGSEIAEAFGRSEWTGYTPDQFGLMSQLPQVYRGFGIRDAILGRGYRVYEEGDEGEPRHKSLNTEFDWIGADGSRVNGIFLKWWYNNAQRFSADEEKAFKFLTLIEQAMAPHISTPYRLLMNGVDHLEAQEDLLPILQKLQERLGDAAVIKQSTLKEYLEKVRTATRGTEKQTIRGELRYGDTPHVLQGTLSSRPYLKTLNARAQNLIELQLEPLYVMLEWMTAGAVRHPYGFIRYVWKELLKNHPHDSICGCSTDRVHQDNENRFLRVRDCTGELLARGMKQLLERVDRSTMEPTDYLLAVVNTLPFERSAVVTAEVYPRVDDRVESFVLLDEHGCEVEYELLQAHLRNRTVLTPINLPGQVAVHDLRIRFQADAVPPCGYRMYRLRVQHGQPHFEQDQQSSVPAAQGAVLKNDCLEVAIDAAGCVDITHLGSGHTTTDLIGFEDVPDRGDAYGFTPSTTAAPFDFRSVQPTITRLEDATQMQAVQLDYTYGEPADRIRLTLSLAAGSRSLDLDVEVDNHSENHRLRLLVHTDIETDENISSQPFDCIRRNRAPQFPKIRDDWTQPNNGLVSVQNEIHGLSVFSEGLYEYEHLLNERSTLALTLVRATGRIANDPMCTGEEDVEPAAMWAAPENQCLRNVSFRLAIRPGKASEAALMQEMQAFHAPLLSAFHAADSRKFSGGRPCVQDSELQEFFYRELPEESVKLPLSQGGLALSEEVVFSALKHAERGRGWVLRFFNPADTEATACIEFAHPVSSLTQTDLRENSMDGAVGSCLTVGAKKIVSLRFE